MHILVSSKVTSELQVLESVLLLIISELVSLSANVTSHLFDYSIIDVTSL